MKKQLFIMGLALVVLLPVISLLSACSVGTVKYVSYLPTVYEAELKIMDSDGNSDTYKVIKRYETIGEQEYYVFYGKYKTSVMDNSEEWFCVWNETNAEWDSYQWSKEDKQWNQAAIGNLFDEVTRAATFVSYGDGVELNKTDLVNETDEYLEYNWGGTYADRLKISNNDYHICLYHGYNDNGEFTSYDKFKTFIFDESTTPIPHIDKFSFAA